jgi:UDP-N-acetylglucosamine:LPS N-acetylglucosamine transferase
MAVSSGGGHWVQLLRLTPAFDNCDVTFVTVNRSYRSQVPGHRFYAVTDANRWTKIALIKAAFALAFIMLKERPDVVVSTGAAPGYLALRIGRFIHARTIWLDSVANVEQLSLSGQKMGPYADLWLTQWQHLATPNGPRCLGTVL